MFIIDMLAAYCDEKVSSPVRWAETVIEMFRVEESYDMVAHAPYTHLCRKIMAYFAHMNAWVSCWRVDKQKDYEYSAFPVREGSACRRVQMWPKNLKKSAEKEPVLREDGGGFSWPGTVPGTVTRSTSADDLGDRTKEEYFLISHTVNKGAFVDFVMRLFDVMKRGDKSFGTS